MCAGEQTFPSPSSATDATLTQVWIEQPSINRREVISSEGLEHIAGHKYKGGQYTTLDLALDDTWKALTKLLPLWLAPNMVTTIGGLLMLVSYFLIWAIAPNWDEECPSWSIFVCGLCIIAYYTLDCMDGKQARRTGASSPLGQLFDHGVDCLSTMLQISTVGAFTQSGGSARILAIQTSTQFLFYICQWEEYYTGVLQHANGDLGVTEVNYGMGLATIVNALVNRNYWHVPMEEFLPIAIVGLIPPKFASFTVLQIGTVLWVSLMIVCAFVPLLRVYRHVESTSVFLKALSKLTTPFLLLTSTFIIPSHIISEHTRFLSISVGLLLCLLSIKTIVHSMAKMPFAVFQIEAIPYCALCLYLRCSPDVSSDSAKLLLSFSAFLATFSLISWARASILQISQRLDIYCFSIKKNRIKQE